ncbi:DNA primase family protein [Rhizobium sullae]|uniref:Putative DNA primase/helicase n=1 Tax=Rhizobium sullae TaxID=50338 RepID=A0A4R3QDL1_RHISU|nr:DNA primase family protein [Rhizobium sullae]TCU18807.1 putative DNA primase/helicase [Rhizobium sullae]
MLNFNLGLPPIPGVTVTEFKERTYEQILAEASNLSADDVTTIERICEEAAGLSPIKKDAILRQIHLVTGIAKKMLTQQAEGNANNSEPDQLELARKVIASIGPENILQSGQFTWKFAPTGVWKRCDDREVKQGVQTTLENERLAVTSSRVNGVTEVLKSDIFKADHEFNRGNPESVNCLNGELELLGEHWLLRPHRRELYRTTQIPIAFDPSATAPLFWQFLNEIFRDDPDRNHKITVVLEMMGYSLMGHANREKFMLLIGAGANGKSVILATLESLLGKENVAGVQPANFDNRFQRGHLDQKLANIVTELKQGETIADAELKAITSGEPATVEHKNKDPFVMRPFATCWFGTNHMPHTRDYSDAFFRRAIVVPFNRVFGPHEQDPGLKEKLTTELPGILNYVLWAYAQVVKRGGFTVPASSFEAQRKWQIEANQVAQFVEDRCEGRADGRATIEFLYETYKGWAQAVGVRQTLGQRHFCDRLEQLGFNRAKGTAGVRIISGLTLKGMPA